MGFRGAYDIQNFLVLVSRGLRLIAVNMYYVKVTDPAWLRPCGSVMCQALHNYVPRSLGVYLSLLKILSLFIILTECRILSRIYLLTSYL